MNKGLRKEDKFPKLQLVPRSGHSPFEDMVLHHIALTQGDTHCRAGSDHAEQHPPIGAGLMHSSAGFNATK